MRRMGPALLLAAAVAFGACATTGGAGEVDAITVEVENTLVPPAALTVYIVPEGGVRERLGSVSPNATENFTFRPGTASRYQFVAETAGGADLVSNPFTIPGDAQWVTWDLAANLVSVN
ncbi:MAG: hypothetical protein ACOC3J_06595 [Gemmatimonadota bacterium]